MNSNNNKMQKFTVWLVTSIVLGALPWFVNFLIYTIADQANYFSIFRINDLMFFVIVISATTLLDMLLMKETTQNSTNILFSILLIIQVAIAALFIGISSLNIAIPPTSGPFVTIQNRLITGSLVLCSFSFITTITLQIYICFFHKVYK
ncbi:MAG: hypothetical protein GF353_26850 [Candidatus Lokiarchaeota archaeon]|nr:hypothetical protein [Candidatus Lokiarchaeota archaeon]